MMNKSPLHHSALIGLVLSGCSLSDYSVVYSDATVEAAPEVCVEDSDGDGLSDCEELELGTAVHLPDTDGDGFSDYQEVIEFGFSPENNNYAFNPRIADAPRVDLAITRSPSIQLRYADSAGVEQVHAVQRSQSSSEAVVTGHVSTNSLAVEWTETTGSSLLLGGAAGFPADLETRTDATVRYEASHGTSQETSFTWTDAQLRENREALAAAEALAADEGATLMGGSLAITVDVKNSGDIAYTLTDVVLGASMSTPGRDTLLAPVGDLAFDDTQGSLSSITYAPSQQDGPFVFENTALDLGTVDALLADSTNLHVRVVSYELTDVEGRAFSHDQREIQAKTATIIVDYAGDDTLLDSERYQVATNLDSESPRISVETALTEILQLPFTVESGELTSIRDVANSTERNGHWVAVHRSSDGVVETVDVMGPEHGAVDFSNVELKAGDLLHLVYVEDADDDGLGWRQELAYGTAVDSADTDGDGLLDGEEVNDWKTDPTDADVDGDGLTDGQELLDFGTEPFVADTDGDGLVDGAELEAGTDPLVPDTDGDGLQDGAELDMGTNPLDGDSDDDCLTDGEEVFGTDTDPLALNDGICAPLANPTTIDWYGRQMTYSNLGLGSASQTLHFAAPGESVSFESTWTLAVPTSDYCPGCIVQFYVGIQDEWSTCLTNRNMFHGSTDGGAISEAFEAPTEPGVYYVTQDFTLQYSCEAKNVTDAFDSAVSTLVVMREF